jgi:thiol-disulfide isomerase/thioredoxin
MKKIKTFSILVLTAFVLLTNYACTKEKNEVKQDISMNQGNPQMLASDASGAANTANGRVFTIGTVTKGKSGMAADFTWTDGGTSQKFSDLTKGKVVLLNFWGTWCGPCRREIPDLIEVNKELQGKDFVLIGIAAERGASEDENFKKVSDFVQDKGINYNVFIANRDIVEAYGGLPVVPETYIIDKNGKISETIVGMKDKDEFMESINRVLK